MAKSTKERDAADGVDTSVEPVRPAEPPKAGEKAVTLMVNGRQVFTKRPAEK